MEGTQEVGWRPFMPASTLSGRSVALLRVRLDDCTPSAGQLISPRGHKTLLDSQIWNILCWNVNNFFLVVRFIVGGFASLPIGITMPRLFAELLKHYHNRA